MTTFVVADLHIGHHGVVKFLKEDGSKLRPWNTIEEMDEALVDNWNKTVGPKDKVYLLGDAVINRRALPTLGRLNGDKVLVKGNHDVFRLEEYTPYFRDIRGSMGLDGYVLTHIPIHYREIAPTGRWKANVHGHLHDESVMQQNSPVDSPFIGYIPDTRYKCVSVEQTGFKPMAWDDVLKHFEEKT